MSYLQDALFASQNVLPKTFSIYTASKWLEDQCFSSCLRIEFGGDMPRILSLLFRLNLQAARELFN